MRRLVLLVVLVLVAGWVAVVVRFVLRPVQDGPRHADAVVVLAGDHLRLGKALELMTRRVAPTLVISDGLAPGWREANRLCRRGAGGFRVLCFRPDPYSTRGEARAVARLATLHRWRSVLVVTSTYHVTRARLLFERCFRGRVAVVGASYSVEHLPGVVASEWAKLVYALTVARDC